MVVMILFDNCIHCGIELAVPERNRVECWECRDQISETYAEDEDVEFKYSDEEIE
jgi:hypothetical protein